MAQVVVYWGKCDKCGQIADQPRSTAEEAEEDARNCPDCTEDNS